MSQNAQLIAAIMALWASSCTLAGIILKIEEARIGEWRRRSECCETDARAAVAAKDEELKEWRRLVQAQIEP